MLLTPDRTGLPQARRRRAPGLRLEEVAALAGISADWYSRIELGTGAVPSVPTLQAIGRALQLGALDARYLFELAGLPVPPAEPTLIAEPLGALEHALLDLRETAGVVYDLFGSPRGWNAIADGMFRWSTYPDAFSRNGIVAGLTNPYYREFFGDDFDDVSRGIVGVFRRAYTTSDPPPLARRVYEFASQYPLFQAYWNEHSVSEEHTRQGPLVRYVPEVGRLCIDFNDLTLLRARGLIIRLIAPHDEATRVKFAQLAKIGTPSRLLTADD